LLYNITYEDLYYKLKNNIIDELILELIIYIYNEFEDYIIFNKIDDIKKIINNNKLIKYQIMIERYIKNII